MEKAWKRKQRENKRRQELEELQKSELSPAFKEEAFFKALGIGELRGANGKSKGQWWVPTELARFNKYMIQAGFYSKQRRKTLLAYLENKEPTGVVADALAGYTEVLLKQG